MMRWRVYARRVTYDALVGVGAKPLQALACVYGPRLLDACELTIATRCAWRGLQRWIPWRCTSRLVIDRCTCASPLACIVSALWAYREQRKFA